MAFLSQAEVSAIGFSSVGRNVQISDKASFYGASRIQIGNNVRIDDFAVLSAGLEGIFIGSNVHIAISVSIIGAGKITLSDFCGLSSRVTVYSSSDDFSGASLTGPTVPKRFTNVHVSDVFLGKHVIVGTGSVILPGVVVEDGVAIAALSFVNKHLSSFGIYAGNPIRRIRDRLNNILELEASYLNSQD